jgi:hypothetical protein
MPNTPKLEPTKSHELVTDYKYLLGTIRPDIAGLQVSISKIMTLEKWPDVKLEMNQLKNLLRKVNDVISQAERDFGERSK